MTGSQRNDRTANEKSDEDASADDDVSADEEAPPSEDVQPDQDLTELNYAQARDELVTVVQQLETDGVPLAESLALWERGERLAAICQQWLDGAKQRVENARRGDTDAPDEA